MCVRGGEVYNSDGSYKPRFDLAAFFSLSLWLNRFASSVPTSRGGGFGPYKWRHPGMLASKKSLRFKYYLSVYTCRQRCSPAPC